MTTTREDETSDAAAGADCWLSGSTVDARTLGPARDGVKRQKSRFAAWQGFSSGSAYETALANR